MTMVKDGGGGTFVPAPVGTHRAICVQIIELGVLPQANAQISETFKVMLGWELCDVTIEAQDDSGMAVARRQIVSKEYTLSIGDKANLGKDLVSWRGRAFTAEEKKGFQLETIIGQPALLSIQHKVSGAGKTYAKVAAVMGPQKAERANYPQPVTELLHYEVEQFTGGNWDKLPEWIQSKIGTSEEYLCKARNSPDPANHDAPIQGDTAPPADDDVPF